MVHMYNYQITGLILTELLTHYGPVSSYEDTRYSSVLCIAWSVFIVH